MAVTPLSLVSLVYLRNGFEKALLLPQTLYFIFCIILYTEKIEAHSQIDGSDLNPAASIKFPGTCTGKVQHIELRNSDQGPDPAPTTWILFSLAPAYAMARPQSS